MGKTLKDFISPPTTNSDFLSFEYIKKDVLELREYQKNILENIKDRNTLVVLPTGLGKTVIAILLSAMRLKKYPESSVLVLAPTKPLVSQHKKTFSKIMDLPEDRFIAISGSYPQKKRAELWKKKGIFFATPQTVKNDIENNILSLADFSLLVVDEAHRCVGEYAYTFVAKKYKEESKYPLILGLTASPGSELEKIGAVIGNLFIENVEIRSYSDPDVKPYVNPLDIEWVHVVLSNDIKQITSLLENAYKSRISILREKNFVHTSKVSKKELLDLQKRISGMLSKEKSDALFYISYVLGQAIKIQYSLELVETQGVAQFVDYFERLKKEEKKTKSLRDLLEDEDFLSAYLLAKKMYDAGVVHPKIEKLKEILNNYLEKDKKCIVFTQYVETARHIVRHLHELGSVLFIGQRKGYSQKKQLQILEDFRKGKFNVLVATSVAEEGLDIPAVDLVVFYEPIPSEIRSIQRRGRTGRFGKGKVVVLITKNTLDEAYYWASISKERNMRRTLHKLKQLFSQKYKTITNVKPSVKTETLNRFTEKNQNSVFVVFDSREDMLKESFVSLFAQEGFIVRKEVLPVGDVVINNLVCIERKSADDFISSFIDGRLFTQLEKMMFHYEIPILIIEGDVFSAIKKRNVHENTFRGVMSKISLDYHIPVLWSKDVEDTAKYIYFISKRVLDEGKEGKRKIIKKAETLQDQQLLVVESLPGVSGVLAERLLEHFGTIKNIANATPESLQKVEGIGEKKAKKIFDVFNAKY